jgi:hypothetical protein
MSDSHHSAAVAEQTGCSNLLLVLVAPHRACIVPACLKGGVCYMTSCAVVLLCCRCEGQPHARSSLQRPLTQQPAAGINPLQGLATRINRSPRVLVPLSAARQVRQLCLNTARPLQRRRHISMQTHAPREPARRNCVPAAAADCGGV